VEQLLGSGAVRADWVGGDALYGGSPGLRRALQARGQAYVLDIQPTLHVYTTDPTPAASPAWSGRGRPPKRRQPVGVAQAIQTVVAAAARAPWPVYPHREGTKGPLRRRALLVPVWLWQADEQTAQAVELLVSSELDGSEVKYSLCYTPPGAPALTVRTAVQRQMQRYWIERTFQEAKQQLGLHQAQTRSWPAWYHHVALTLMAMHFMLEAQLEGDPEIPYLSFASIKLLLARKLRNKLDQDDALQAAIIKRTKYVQRSAQHRNAPT
jgi:SRSO17 transposase